MTEDIDRHVLQKYEIQQKIGKGAYGVVWSAIDKLDSSRPRELVAVKKSRRAAGQADRSC